MSPSKVYFSSFQASSERNIFDKLGDLMNALPLSEVVRKNDIIAIKVHFGERGNTAFVAPTYVRKVVDLVRALGGRPFVTDANTLYVGSRSDSVAHLETAHLHGFSYETLGCPVIIADGLRGGSYVEVPVKGARTETVRLAHELVKADAIVCVTHFKGHELSGFGGAIKNLGMGGGCRGAKLAMHSGVRPRIKAKKCIGCGKCVENCPAAAIVLKGSVASNAVEARVGRKVASLDPKLCIGCGSCIVVCPSEAVSISWDAQASDMQERMVEHLAGYVQQKNGRIAYLNFINHVSPACDCYGFSDQPIVADIGVLASLDPVAVDAACNELVIRAQGLHPSALKSSFAPGTDKFRDLYPDVDGTVQLTHAQALGLGSREHQIIEIA